MIRFKISPSSVFRTNLLNFQSNASGWLREEAWRRWFSVQWHAAGRELKLREQLQEEVCLPVSPPDQHLLFHPLYPFHQPKHLSVRLQVCFISIFIFIALPALLTNSVKVYLESSTDLMEFQIIFHLSINFVSDFSVKRLWRLKTWMRHIVTYKSI